MRRQAKPMRALWLAIAAAGLALAACERSPAPTDAPVEAPARAKAAAFTHAFEGDLSGYYLPAAPVAVGPYELSYLALGLAFEFDRWEGGDRTATWAPVMLVFADASSPLVTGETGQVGHGATVRVLPTAYAITGDTVRFTGTAPELGEVRFEGRLDQGRLATARRNLGEEAPVLTGTLTVGGRTFAGQSFTWFGGD